MGRHASTASSPRPAPALADAAARLHGERATLIARVAHLAQDMLALIDASRDSNVDDEHDPEGQTIAYERSQLSAVAGQASDHLREVDAERVEARPTARTCPHHTGALRGTTGRNERAP